MPVEGPPRITSTTTTGTSAATARPMRLGHQRESRAGGRRQRGHAAVRRADRHVDRGQLVLGLQQRAADLGQRRRHPFEQLGRRRDRIGGDEAHAAADRAVARGLVAADQPALAGRLAHARRAAAARAWPAAASMPACSAVRFAFSAVRVALPRGAQRAPRAPRRGMPGEAAGEAERDHVDPAAGDRLGHLLQRHAGVARAAGEEHRGRLALVGCRRSTRPPASQRDLVGEAVHVLPVEGEQQVEAVVERVHRRGAQAQQRRRLAAADLRAAGAHHQAVQARLRGGLQQHGAGGHHAAAAGAGDGDRQARAGGVCGRRGAVGASARVRGHPRVLLGGWGAVNRRRARR